MEGPPPGLMIFMGGMLVGNAVDDLVFAHYGHAGASIVLAALSVLYAWLALRRRS